MGRQVGLETTMPPMAAQLGRCLAPGAVRYLYTGQWDRMETGEPQAPYAFRRTPSGDT